MWIGTSAARVVRIIGIAHVISMVLGSNIFVDVIGGDDVVVVNHTDYYLLKGQYTNAQGEIQLRGSVGKKSTQANMETRHGSTNNENWKRQGNTNDAMRQGNTKTRGHVKKSKGSKKQSSNRPPSSQNRPPRNPGTSCFSVEMYDSIDEDIAAIKNNIRSDQERSHFLGGIVRLAAHDFMDYDHNDPSDPMGPDGCYDPNHPSNAGLDTIWCTECKLRELYRDKYPHLSRADFWIAAANAVIRQTSISNSLDLRETFVWGRKDLSVCRGSGLRLPQSTGCDEVEDVFLERMGLTWTDAVALLGAHTLGRGDRRFSGHEGSWSSSANEAQVFDKKYYEAFFTETWRPRNMGEDNQDWTTGNGDTRMMLNTDMCLVFDIDEYVERNIPCCTRTNSHFSNGQNQCVDSEAASRRCPMYSSHSGRRDATDAVREMLGGSLISKNNAPFYINFAKAWKKATTLGQNNLSPLKNRCEEI